MDSFIILLFVLLLLVSGSHASHYFGAVMTYYPKETFADGSISVVLRYKLNFHTCTPGSWYCTGNCGTLSQSLSPVKVDESINVWCQTEGFETRLLPNNSALQLVFNSAAWINNVQGVAYWRAVTNVELRNRSDIGRPNTSPQTTILPALRVPSNCSRNFDLLNFDPDGDEVKCRYANGSLSECQDCTPPPVLSLSSSCTLTFSSVSRSPDNNEQSYVVQLVMEDFSRYGITLTQTNGVQEVKTTSEGISKISVQFALTVVPAVPSCVDGEYLPRFLYPTPDNRAHLYTPVNQILMIPVIAEATRSTIAGLLFSGPYNVAKTTSGSGNFTLTWTPSAAEDGQSHSICFVVQANFTQNLFDSELRCVIVAVGNVANVITTTTATPMIMNPLPVNATLAPTSTIATSPVNATLAHTSTVATSPANATLAPTSTVATSPANATLAPTSTIATSPANATLAPTSAIATSPANATLAPTSTIATAPANATLAPTSAIATAPANATLAPTSTIATAPANATLAPTSAIATSPANATLAPASTIATAPANATLALASTIATSPVNATLAPTSAIATAPANATLALASTIATSPVNATLAPTSTIATSPVNATLAPTSTVATPPVNATLAPTSTIATSPVNATLAPASTIATSPVNTTFTPTTLTPNTAATHTPAVSSPTTSVTFVPAKASTPTSTTHFTSTSPLTTSTSVPGPYYVVGLNVKISTTLSLENDYDAIVRQIKDELVRRGLPSTITLRISSSGSVTFTTPAPP